ncbi:MAG: lipopolysaccharide transport periplasmic protein LptA [Candidatus Anaerobiospirillum pullicola]|uniref:Lipopolysaccharide export system protein LptA n=1 Tax=Candidatus Anaerobiospirillum pullicola TaxID=2838451 RepID=A0A948TG76_9GAMM|nr:lipopolysaccharide transport periplasmic protein LptA [Candidatus Anaerobiospirillum pullicola]
MLCTIHNQLLKLRMRSALSLSPLLWAGCALGSFLLLASPAQALESDKEQPITIESVEQSADLQTNKLLFSGDVVATQGSIKLTADKVEVTRNTDGSLQSIVAYGNPTTFEQKQDNGRYIRSRSTTISYLPAETKIVLQGRAVIWQGDSRMSGERIEYNINTQRMYAVNNNSQGGRVLSTFVPADFNKDKDAEKK